MVVGARLLEDRGDRDRHQRDEAQADAAPVADPGAELLRHHQPDAEEAQRDAGPLQRAQPLGEEAPGDQRGQHRVEADDQRRDPGLGAERDRLVDAAEIDRVQQHADQRRVARLRPRGPGRAGQHHPGAEERRGEREAQRQEGRRLDIGQPVLRPDEAGAPEQDEGGRRQRRRAGALGAGRGRHGGRGLGGSVGRILTAGI